MGLGAGNGTAKNITGLNVGLAAFNGSDNNFGVPLTVGQDLSFDAWHSVSLVIDQGLDHYVSLTVDGQSEDLSAFTLPDGFTQGQPVRGNLLQQLRAEIIAGDGGGDRTNDDIYWDNVSMTASPVPVPSTLTLLGASVVGLMGYVLRRRLRAA